MDWAITGGPAWLAAHAAFGLALVVAALAAVAVARGGSRVGTAVAVLGALAVIGAGCNGPSFLDYGHAFSSLIMAALWALALACYLTRALLAAARMSGKAGSAGSAGRAKTSERRR